MSEKSPVALVTYVSNHESPVGLSPMKDREIMTVFDHGDLSYRDHCVYKDGKVFVDDTPNDSNWPSVELIVDDAKSGLGWHGWYRAFSTRQAAEAWVADPEAPLREFVSQHGMTPEEFRLKYGNQKKGAKNIMERKWTVGWDREQATDLLSGSVEDVGPKFRHLGIRDKDTKEHFSDILTEARRLKDSVEPWNNMDAELKDKWPNHLKEKEDIAALPEESLRVLLEQKGFSQGWITRYLRSFWNDARALAEYKRLHEQFPLGLDEPDRHALTVQQKYR